MKKRKALVSLGFVAELKQLLGDTLGSKDTYQDRLIERLQYELAVALENNKRLLEENESLHWSNYRLSEQVEQDFEWSLGDEYSYTEDGITVSGIIYGVILQNNQEVLLIGFPGNAKCYWEPDFINFASAYIKRRREKLSKEQYDSVLNMDENQLEQGVRWMSAREELLRFYSVVGLKPL